MDHNNNQPLNFDEGSLCFNGVIDMRSKKEMEAHYGLNMITDNDGEILLKINEFNPLLMAEWVIKNKCSFAGLFLKDDTLYAFRNKYRPAWILEYESAIFIASTSDIFIRALGNVEPAEMKPNNLYKWN